MGTCARCPGGTVESVSIEAGGLELELDLCQIHLQALLAGATLVSAPGSSVEEQSTGTVVPLRPRGATRDR